ncbi:MAG: hypothetical protein ACOYBY_16410 [Dermatophilaceae bacterium]
MNALTVPTCQDPDGDQELSMAVAEKADAMVNLAVLSAARMDPPDLDAARYWCERAAGCGELSGWFRLGGVLAQRGDRAGTEEAWRRVIDAVDVHKSTAASAALGLAALAALDGAADMAWPLLQIASACGAEVAGRCAASLMTDQGGQRAALAWLANHDDEMAALNFLGVAAHRDGALSAARAHWRRSVERGDPVAALLLHLSARRAEAGARRPRSG